MSKSKYLSGKRIEPTRIAPGMSVTDLVDGTFQAYNAARLREACLLLTKKMLDDDVTVGLTMTGALTPAGLGMSAVIPPAGSEGTSAACGGGHVPFSSAAA